VARSPRCSFGWRVKGKRLPVRAPVCQHRVLLLFLRAGYNDIVLPSEQKTVVSFRSRAAHVAL
jgi:hypothetical protein